MMVVLVLTLFIFAGVAVIWMGMQSRRQIREMEHRERLAMIERGLAPGDLDPLASEAKLPPPLSEQAMRSRTAGIMIIGIGVAFALLVSLAGGAPQAGVGVGGAAAVIGVAFFVNALMLRHSTPNTSARPPLRRAEPPSSSSSPSSRTPEL
jgi:hypothetical protein